MRYFAARPQENSGFRGLGCGKTGVKVGHDMDDSNDAGLRVRQVVLAAMVLLGLALLICAALVGWVHLPGIWGEWLGTIVGVMSTPFFLEASFLFIGIILVIAINHHRQKRAGDDFVEMEVEESKDSSKHP